MMPTNKKDPTIAEVVGAMTEEKKNALYWYIGSILNIDVLESYRTELRSMSCNEKKVFFTLVEKAAERKLFE